VHACRPSTLEVEAGGVRVLRIVWDNKGDPVSKGQIKYNKKEMHNS
jgi:hypothetical protein